MGHGAHLGKEHAALATRLQHGAAALVEPADPSARAAWQEIIETLFSREDAVLAAKLPLLPTPLSRIADRAGLEKAAARARLDAMADKGLVLDLPDPGGGETVYMIAPPMVGFFEFSMMRLADHLPKAKLAKAYDIYVHDPEFMEELSKGDTVLGRALVHESTLFDDLLSEILDWERAGALIEGARKVSVTNCYCRHKALHLDKPCQKSPLEVCMSLGTAADYLIRHGLGREISREQAMEILTAGREAGLVHIADNLQQDVTYICSCCSCCCEELDSVRRGRSLVVPSGFQPVVEAETCNGCGACRRACPVEAISLVPRMADDGAVADSAKPLARIDLGRCVGCGVCAGQCRQDSIEMQRRSQQRHVPVNMVEFAVRSMIERGRIADLLIDGTTGRGPAFANAVVRTILSLPLADRLAASEQMRSRFVNFALSKVRVAPETGGGL